MQMRTSVSEHKLKYPLGPWTDEQKRAFVEDATPIKFGSRNKGQVVSVYPRRKLTHEERTREHRRILDGMFGRIPYH